MRIPFAVGSYESRSAPWASQRLINWYPEAAPQYGQSKTPVVLLPRPACRPFKKLAKGPVRGLIEFNGELIAVGGNSAYRVAADGSTADEIGPVGGSGPVIMDKTDIEVTISTGSAAYVVDSGAITQVSAAGFLGSAAVTMLDNFFVHTVPGASRQFQVSGVRAGLEFDALDFATKESRGDALVRAVAHGFDLWLMGALSTEAWRSVSGGGFPFARSSGVLLDRGLAAKHSVVSLGQGLFWLADDKIFYLMKGYSPEPISKPAIVKKVEDDGSDGIAAWGYEQDGHAFYIVTNPWHWTLVFDMHSGFWAERQTLGYEFWDAWLGGNFFGKVLAGSFLSGWIYELPATGDLMDVKPR
jgi:hypothetical protein